MNATSPPTSFVGWEHALTRRFLMVGDDGDASPIRSFGITPDDLAAVAGTVGAAAGAEALASFRSSVCRGGIGDALEKGNYPSGMAPRDVPGCFAYLVVTLLAASQPAEGTGFSVPNASVTSKRGVSPKRWPSSLPTPLGRSTAIRRVAAAASRDSPA